MATCLSKIILELGIKIHVVGIGGSGYAPMPVTSFFGRTVVEKVAVEYDEETLQQIAKLTNGVYFNAKNTEKLKQVYEEINQLEVRKESYHQYVEWKEQSHYYLLACAIFYLLYQLLISTTFAAIP